MPMMPAPASASSRVATLAGAVLLSPSLMARADETTTTATSNATSLPTALGPRPSVSWLSARDECASRNATLCSSSRLCPANVPFDDGDAIVPGTWVPVADGVDEWIRYGAWPYDTGGVRCALHSATWGGDPHPCHTHPDPAPYPELGLYPDVHGGCAMSHVYCCDGCDPPESCAGLGSCDPRGCLSPGPDADTGHDCWAGLKDEPCSCSFGRAAMTGNKIEAHVGTLYEYTCCLPAPGETTATRPTPGENSGERGEVCGDYVPGGGSNLTFLYWLVPLLVASYLVPMAFMHRRYARAAKAAASVPTVGYTGAPPSANEVDVCADASGPSVPFRTMGSAKMMDARLEPHMSRREYSELFAAISDDVEEAARFRVWHLLMWPPMIAFWAVGGFMIMIWGIKTGSLAAIAAIGRRADPFFETRRGLSYVVIPAQHGGGIRSTTRVRIVLPPGDIG